MSVWEEVDQEMCQTGPTNPTNIAVRSDKPGMLPERPARIKAWRDKVLAADTRKAGSASDATRLLILLLPSVTMIPREV